MEKINPDHWKFFSHEVRKHWPQITDEELMTTEGYYNQVEYLIENKSTAPVDRLREELKEIFEKTSQMH